MRTNAGLIIWFSLMAATEVLFSGCTSLPEADNENQTLVIGIVNIQHRYFPSSSSVEKKTRVTITLQELSGKKIYSITSRSDGLFYSTKIPQGSYKLTKTVYIMGRTTRKIIPRGIHSIEILKGTINNLGTISFKPIDKKTGSISWNSGYDEAKNLFQLKYNFSNWLEKEWVETVIKRPNPGGLMPITPQPIIAATSQPEELKTVTARNTPVCRVCVPNVC